MLVVLALFSWFMLVRSSAIVCIVDICISLRSIFSAMVDISVDRVVCIDGVSDVHVLCNMVHVAGISFSVL